MKITQTTEATYNLLRATFFSRSRSSREWLLSWQCWMLSAPSFRDSSWLGEALKWRWSISHMSIICHTTVSNVLPDLDKESYYHHMMQRLRTGRGTGDQDLNVYQLYWHGILMHYVTEHIFKIAFLNFGGRMYWKKQIDSAKVIHYFRTSHFII